MKTQDRKKEILKGKIIIALNEELGRKPTDNEIDRYFLAARVLRRSIIPAFFEKQQALRNIHQMSLL